MNISPVSSRDFYGATSSSSTASASQTAKIQNQIKVLQQKIQAENASRDDPLTKQAKISAFQTQLASLQGQLALLSAG